MTIQENEYEEQEFTGQPQYNRYVVEDTPQWDTKAYPS